jgi:putative phosphoribosyl transferase
MMFQDRCDAGRCLAARLAEYRGAPNLLLLGLPRGGVVVAFQIAAVLHVPFDVLVVRKLGVPGREELAMGAIANGNVVVRNPSVLEAADISDSVFQEVVERERAELARREIIYREHRPLPAIHDRSVILVDDGLATGATMQAAIEAVRMQQPASLVVAVPVAALSTCKTLRPMVDDLVCLATPRRFVGVGQWYRDFGQTTDEEVRQLLDEANQRLMATSGG